MRILSHSILHLFRRPNVYTAPSPVHHLSYHSQALFASVTSAPPVLPRRVFPVMATPNPPGCRLSRHLYAYLNMAPCSIGVKGKKLDKPNRRPANDIMISLGEGTAKEFNAYGDVRLAHGKQNARNTYGDEGACLEVLHGQCDTAEKILDDSDYEIGSDVEEGWAPQIAGHPIENVFPLDRLPRSGHRNGSIYRNVDGWKKTFRVTDRGETRLEPMKLSNPARCLLGADGHCVLHQPSQMLQIFSMKLARIHVDGGGLVELYGYIAARDGIDRLLNHFISISRDDPIMVEQGSPINIIGPKRGIELLDTIIIEYDMRIKIGKQEKDDLQLIDGVSIIDDIDTEDRRIFKGRIHGKSGAIDITASRLDWAVESTIEVLISDVYSNFSLCVSCFTSGLQEETQLFDGVIGESRGLKRSVVAVRIGTNLDLKFKVGSESSICAEHLCSFVANEHGYVIQEIETALALISVKVTWSTLPRVRTF